MNVECDTDLFFGGGGNSTGNGTEQKATPTTPTSYFFQLTPTRNARARTPNMRN